MNLLRFVTLVICVLIVAALAFAGPAPKSTDKKGQQTASKEQTKQKSGAVKTEAPKSNKIEWVAFDEGLRRAEAENKSLLVDFTASWCGWCKRMEAETFSDTAVMSMIQQNYIPVRVWGDSDSLLDIKGYKISQKDLAISQFGVQGYPTFFFLCPEGLGYKRVVGYRDASSFRTELTSSVGFNCDSLKTAYDNAQKQQEQQPQQPAGQEKSDG